MLLERLVERSGDPTPSPGRPDPHVQPGHIVSLDVRLEATGRPGNDVAVFLGDPFSALGAFRRRQPTVPDAALGRHPTGLHVANELRDRSVVRRLSLANHQCGREDLNLQGPKPTGT